MSALSPFATFIVDLENPGSNVSIARTSPYFGENSSCPHNGAHIHFTKTTEENEGLVNIIAPANGSVSEIKLCKNISESDGFQIDLNFDDTSFQNITLEMSIEPQNGFHCVTSEGGTADYYAPYILVAEGDTVTEGDIIAQLPIASTTDGGAHIHFNLRGNETACPNIFSDTITENFGSFFDSFPCEIPTTNTFCFGPSVTEDLTSLGTENP